MGKGILEVTAIRKHFAVNKGLVLARAVGWIKAVDGLNLSVQEGETLGLVGESGCGKTTLAKMILLLEKPTSGGIVFQGKDIFHLSPTELRDYRSSVQAVFQDPYGSLNPRWRIGDIISEPLMPTGRFDGPAAKERVKEVLEWVGLAPSVADRYPHEFSGGQQQRIAIARAISSSPRIIVLDEPVAALDVSVRAQIINLIKHLQERLGTTYIIISHSLAVIKHMSSRICVMYLGKIVEQASSEELYRYPMHPYTRALFAADLPSHPDAIQSEIELPGEVPSAFNPPSGCHFHPRCVSTMPACRELEPTFKEVAKDHFVACHLC